MPRFIPIQIGFPRNTLQYLCLFLSPHSTLLALKAGGCPRSEGEAGVLGGQEAHVLFARVCVVERGVTPSRFSSGADERGRPSPALGRPLCAVRGYCVQLHQSGSLKKKLCIRSPRRQRTFTATPSFRLGLDSRTGYYSQDNTWTHKPAIPAAMAGTTSRCPRGVRGLHFGLCSLVLRAGREQGPGRGAVKPRRCVEEMQPNACWKCLQSYRKGSIGFCKPDAQSCNVLFLQKRHQLFLCVCNFSTITKPESF